MTVVDEEATLLAVLGSNSFPPASTVFEIVPPAFGAWTVTDNGTEEPEARVPIGQVTMLELFVQPLVAETKLVPAGR